MAKKVKVWHRNRPLEARAKTNFMYRVGMLFGILLSWVGVGTGAVTFAGISLVAVVLVVTFSLWDFWKMWKGGPYE